MTKNKYLLMLEDVVWGVLGAGVIVGSIYYFYIQPWVKEAERINRIELTLRQAEDRVGLVSQKDLSRERLLKACLGDEKIEGLLCEVSDRSMSYRGARSTRYEIYVEYSPEASKGKTGGRKVLDVYPHVHVSAR